MGVMWTGASDFSVSNSLVILFLLEQREIQREETWEGEFVNITFARLHLVEAVIDAPPSL